MVCGCIDGTCRTVHRFLNRFRFRTVHLHATSRKVKAAGVTFQKWLSVVYSLSAVCCLLPLPLTAPHSRSLRFQLRPRPRRRPRHHHRRLRPRHNPRHRRHHRRHNHLPMYLLHHGPRRHHLLRHDHRRRLRRLRLHSHHLHPRPRLHHRTCLRPHHHRQHRQMCPRVAPTRTCSAGWMQQWSLLTSRSVSTAAPCRLDSSPRT